MKFPTTHEMTEIAPRALRSGDDMVFGRPERRYVRTVHEVTWNGDCPVAASDTFHVTFHDDMGSIELAHGETVVIDGTARKWADARRRRYAESPHGHNQNPRIPNA